MSISITKGLKRGIVARAYTIDQAVIELKKFTNNYELMKAVNRIYGDIDCKGFEGTEEEFNLKNNQTKIAIEKFLGDEPASIMTASSYEHRIISWRFVFTKKMCSIEDNKKWVIKNVETIELPEGVAFDSAPYAKQNQKMRMLGSNKDGENRPLTLVRGNVEDTLISFTDGCELMEMPREKKAKKKEVIEPINDSLLERLVMNIANDGETTWEQWYKVAQAIFNENGTEELFLRWSSKSPKHNEREAMAQWKSLKKPENNGLTSGSLYYWSSLNDAVVHNQIIVDCCSENNYYRQKILFEKDHFKVKNPPSFVRQEDGQLQFMKKDDLFLLYENKYCEKDGETSLFITLWKADPYIRTYDRIVFKPNEIVPKTIFNIFTDFHCIANKGSIDTMNELMWLLSGKDKVVQEYIEKYFAHMIQQPQDKPGVALLFFSEKQGAGKDTPLDFIGKIIGRDYFYNTEDAENQVFGRFTSHLQKVILLKLEEAEFETNKRNESSLLSMITAKACGYEGKGRDSLMLDDFKRIVLTTNKHNAVSVPESDRRMVLINSSEDKVGDREFWDAVYKDLAKPETMQAYYYHLRTMDLSGFNVRIRPITNYYKDVKTAQRPYHASFFQKWIALHGEHHAEREYSASEWVEKINEGTKFPVSSTKFGMDVKKYPDEVFTKTKGKYANSYTLHTKGMHEFLVEKGWWADI